LGNIDANTKLCALIAHPSGHTLSPLIHNTLAKITGENIAYTAFDVEEKNLNDAIKGGKALGIKGFNVSVPHKEEVIKYIDRVSDIAEKIGAVNTIVNENGEYVGYNTDVTGIYRSLKKHGISIKDKDVIILGAGGVARAVVFLMAQKGARNIYILNRSIERAKSLCKELKEKMGEANVFSLKIDEYEKIPKGKYLCIQCTKVGMYPDNDSAVIEDDEFYNLVEFGFDVVYRPGTTKFMRKLIEKNIACVNGLEMLMYQGVEAFELWTGQKIPEKDCDFVLKKLQDELYSQNNVVLIGFMGSGKTTVGKALAEELSIEYIDTDVHIESVYENKISDIFDAFGEDYFRKIETEQLLKLLEERDSRKVISCGGGMILRKQNRQILKKFGKTVYLRTTAKSIYERIKDDTTRPLLMCSDKLSKIEELLEKRKDIYECAADIIIDTDNKNIEEIVNEIIKSV